MSHAHTHTHGHASKGSSQAVPLWERGQRLTTAVMGLAARKSRRSWVSALSPALRSPRKHHCGDQQHLSSHRRVGASECLWSDWTPHLTHFTGEHTPIFVTCLFGRRDDVQMNRDPVGPVWVKCCNFFFHVPRKHIPPSHLWPHRGPRDPAEIKE